MTESTHVAEPWDFAGWGESRKITDLGSGPTKLSRLDQPDKHTLGAWRATAICGNDITSSVLYVSALCAAQAGALAPVVLLIVAGVLYLFRRIYGEVGSALPLNGGSYTVLLNTTGKRLAAGAAVLTLLSYVATAVISANEAMHYAHNLYSGLNVIWATVAVLGLFAFLNIMGITESAAVALGIFLLHPRTRSSSMIAARTFGSVREARWIDRSRLRERHGIRGVKEKTRTPPDRAADR